jgi:hypothetical protein
VEAYPPHVTEALKAKFPSYKWVAVVGTRYYMKDGQGSIANSIAKKKLEDFVKEHGNTHKH